MRSNIDRTPSGANVPDAMPRLVSPAGVITRRPIRRSLPARGLPRAARAGLLPPRALRGLEEDGEIPQVLVAETGERGHRRSGRLARRIRQVVDLPLDSPVPRSLRREIWGSK